MLKQLERSAVVNPDARYKSLFFLNSHRALLRFKTAVFHQLRSFNLLCRLQLFLRARFLLDARSLRQQLSSAHASLVSKIGN